MRTRAATRSSPAAIRQIGRASCRERGVECGRRHTRLVSDWSSDVCSSDLLQPPINGTAPDALVLTSRIATVAGTTPNVTLASLYVSDRPLTRATTGDINADARRDAIVAGSDQTDRKSVV